MVAVGDKFSRWLVVGGPEKWRSGPKWQCRCDCGVERAVYQFALADGSSRSCGCLQLEGATKHGQYRGGQQSAEHKVWQGLFDRCSNPRSNLFHLYGGRGISICDRWTNFDAFFSDMGLRPSARHSLDRIDNMKGYEPGNCRWATAQQQARNRRSNRRLTFRGETRCMVEWAETLGLPYKVVKDRISRGWSPDLALGSPYSPRIFK